MPPYRQAPHSRHCCRRPYRPSPSDSQPEVTASSHGADRVRQRAARACAAIGAAHAIATPTAGLKDAGHRRMAARRCRSTTGRATRAARMAGACAAAAKAADIPRIGIGPATGGRILRRRRARSRRRSAGPAIAGHAVIAATGAARRDRTGRYILRARGRARRRRTRRPGAAGSAISGPILPPAGPASRVGARPDVRRPGNVVRGRGRAARRTVVPGNKPTATPTIGRGTRRGRYRTPCRCR